MGGQLRFMWPAAQSWTECHSDKRWRDYTPLRASTAMDECPFCNLDERKIVVATPTAIAFPDNFPIADGHTLVVPREHVSSIYELSTSDQADLWRLVAEVRRRLIERFGATSFTIGVNDGLDAGQTVPHAHVHIIPRRPGDVPDPRGGIRWIISDKADYWS